MRPMMEMLRPFFAFVWLFVITLIWSFYSRNNVINLEPRVLWILYGTIFSNIAVRERERDGRYYYILYNFYNPIPSVA